MRNNTRTAFDLEARCEAWAACGYVDEVRPPRPALRRQREALNVLEKLVESQVIPRLLLAHQVSAVPQTQDDTVATLAGRVGELSELVIAADAQASVTFVSNLREQGVSLESVFQDLLAPTARRLGEIWDEDINDFMDVTRGMSQLQLLVRTFGDDLRNEVRAPSSDRRALLMPLLGEQHSFGVSLVADHFRREGWRVWGGAAQSPHEMVDLVRAQWFDVVGLSASKLSDPSSLAKDIAGLRRSSMNKALHVLVGGKIFTECPELVTAVGADATGLDGRQAFSRVQALLAPKDAERLSQC